MNQIGGGLLDLLYPRICQLCGSPDCPESVPFVCGRCLERIPKIDPPCCDRCGMPFEGGALPASDCVGCRQNGWSFERAVSAVRLRGPARDVIHRFKYRRQLYWSRLIGKWMIEAALRFRLSGLELIVPVPLHSRREREREFNQSAVLARELGGTLRMAMSKPALRRTRDTPSQTGLDRADRVENQRNAFAVANPGRVAGRDVILVDDVWTTGATTEECARTLLEAGVKKVLVLTAARG